MKRPQKIEFLTMTKYNTKTSTKGSTTKSINNNPEKLIKDLLNFNYKKATPKQDQIIILNGKFKKKFPHQTFSEERKIFSAKNLLKLPNSKRTINPELNDEPSKRTITHASSPTTYRFNTESSEFNYISNVDNTLPRKKSNPRLYKSSCFDFYSPIASTRRVAKPTLLDKYTKTTQIMNLPGGVKRSTEDINDDEKRIRSMSGNTMRESYQKRVINDHNSNVACLPGCTINTVSSRGRRFNGKKNEEHNIFCIGNNRKDVNNTYQKKKINNIIVYDSKYFGHKLPERKGKQGYHNESHFKIQ